jgi:hypothetical protein
MDYSRLTKEEATDILVKHDEATWTDRLWKEVIEPAKVLYWLDAFGDQSLAINCQGLPKTLPDDVVKGVNEFDVLGEWDGRHQVHECPTCSRELYEFGLGNCEIIDEYGDHHQMIGFLSDESGQMYDALGEHRFMCQGCKDHTRETFGRHASYDGVAIFYGTTENKHYKFRETAGIISRDSWGCYSGDCVDLPVHNEQTSDHYDVAEIERAFAQGGREKMEFIEEELNFVQIKYDQLDVRRTGVGKAEWDVKEILQEWSEALYDEDCENCHPDLDFTYIIENGRKIYCPEQWQDKLEYELKFRFYQKDGQPDVAQSLTDHTL